MHRYHALASAEAALPLPPRARPPPPASPPPTATTGSSHRCKVTIGTANPPLPAAPGGAIHHPPLAPLLPLATIADKNGRLPPITILAIALIAATLPADAIEATAAGYCYRYTADHRPARHHRCRQRHRDALLGRRRHHPTRSADLEVSPLSPHLRPPPPTLTAPPKTTGAPPLTFHADPPRHGSRRFAAATSTRAWREDERRLSLAPRALARASPAREAGGGGEALRASPPVLPNGRGDARVSIYF